MKRILAQIYEQAQKEAKEDIAKIKETLYGDPIDIWRENMYTYAAKKEKSVMHRLGIVEGQITRLEKELKQSQCKHTNQSKECKNCGKEL